MKPENYPVEKKALRHNVNKRQWSLVDFNALEPLVQVLEFGAEKYAPNNWKLGMPISDILDSTMRHLVELMRSETLDKESNLPHTGHIMANIMFLQHYIQKEESTFPF